MVKFAHIADCHLGAFGRNKVLREYNLKSFEKSIQKSIDENVDFIIIAGDLFHNPHPDMEIVKRAVSKLMEARKENINIYSVYGSHDYQISQASLIDVLESADVFKKVVTYLDGENSLKLQKDPTGVSIIGLSGRKNRADVSYYKQLDFPEPEDKGIFVFHSPIAELKPADIHEERSLPLSLIPDGYEYYAGGHLHKRIEHEEEKNIYYPGTTFGANYTDLERDERGFFIVENWEPEYIELDDPKIKDIKIDANELTVKELRGKIEELYDKNYDEDILLLKIFGTLSEGEPSNINFNKVKSKLKDKGLETVYLNRHGLERKETERMKLKKGEKEEKEEKIEKKIFEEYTSEKEVPVGFQEDLLEVLKNPQKEGETKDDYEKRIWKEAWEMIKEKDSYEEKNVEKDRKEEKKESNGKKDKREKKENKEKKKEEKESSEEEAEPEKSEGQISLTDFGG